MKNKIHNYLNRDVKDFGFIKLLIPSIIFLAIVGLISYKTTNNSYALFTDTINGSKVITLHYEEKFDNFNEYLEAKVNKNQTIDFSKAPSDTNGNGINILEGTENDSNPIYFYRGFDTEGKSVVSKNNVLFGGFCWKIVRTTDTGGIKIVYNGEPTEGKCTFFSDKGRSQTTSNISMSSNNRYYYGTEYTFDGTTGYYALSGTKTNSFWNSNCVGKYTCQSTSATGTCTTLYYIDAYNSTSQAKAYSYTAISNKKHIVNTGFNFATNSPAYNGYMYGTVYPYKSGAATSGSLFGSSFTYSGGTYTLTNTQDTKDNTHHYSCNNSTGTCTTIRYYYYNNYYIELTNGKSVSNALEEMQTNTTNSTIKTVIDNWYETNLASYEEYLEDTVWCNDRSIYQLNGWNPEGGDLTKHLYYKGYERNTSTYKPSVTCPNKNDAFTVNDTTKGNGALKYPIALLTADELTMAGSGWSGYSNKSYLYTNQNWWSLSPGRFYDTGAREFYLNEPGYLQIAYDVTYYIGVRPAVSLAPGTSFTSGDGSSENPLKID